MPRKTGSEELHEKFPHAHPLWTLTATNDDGYPNAFTLTAYQIKGTVVLLQQFALHGWDVYVPASRSGRVDDTLDAVRQCVEDERGNDYSNPDAKGA